jgi:hypothetical protein
VYRPLEWFMSLFVNKIDVSFSSMTTIVPFRKDASQVSRKTRPDVSLVPSDLIGHNTDPKLDKHLVISTSR